MIAKYKKNAIIGLGIAIVGAVGMGILNNFEHSPLLNLLGYIWLGFWFWGHYNLAKAKGYSGWLILLGFLAFIGLIILLVLPNRRK